MARMEMAFQNALERYEWLFMKSKTESETETEIEASRINDRLQKTKEI